MVGKRGKSQRLVVTFLLGFTNISIYSVSDLIMGIHTA